MCSVCAGAVCQGAGCQPVVEAARAVIQNPQPVVQVSITYAQTSYAWMNSLFAALFTAFQDFGRGSKNIVTGFLTKHNS